MMMNEASKGRKRKNLFIGFVCLSGFVGIIIVVFDIWIDENGLDEMRMNELKRLAPLLLF